MNYKPKYYPEINSYEANYHPSTVHTTNNAEVAFYEWMLYNRVANIFKWNMPEHWNSDYFKYVLMGQGYIAIVDTPEYGVIPQWCTLTGVGIYYQPTKVNVKTNLVTVTDAIIGEDCALIKFTPFYTGIWWTIHHYAEKLALISSSIDMNLINSRLAYIFGATTKAEIQTLKKLLDQINQGNPAAFTNILNFNKSKKLDGNDPWYTWSRDVKSNYITTDLLTDMRTILNDFDTNFGIPNANTEKRERLITSEVESNNAETACNLITFYESMKQGIEDANRLYNINLSVTPRWGDEYIGKSNTDRL